MSLIKKGIVLIVFIILINLSYRYGYAQEAVQTYPSYQTTKISLNEDYTLISETSDMKLYYKKHNGVFKVEDKRNQYTWTSGIDHDYDQYIEKSVALFKTQNETATPEAISEIALPLEDQMNNTREGIANSFIVVDMMRASDPARSSTQMGSSFKTFVSKTDTLGIEHIIENEKDSVNTDNLYMVDNSDKHFLLDIQFKEFDVEIKVHILVHDTGFEVEIRDHEINGEDSNYINYINIMPFLGSYGGKKKVYNPTTDEWDIDRLKPRHAGYVFVPDGSGAIIDFKDYESSLSGYTGLVYGHDMAKYASDQQMVQSNVPLKTPLMPVFGIAYQDLNAAFVSYAKRGAPFMEIISRPNDSFDSYNLTNYTISFPRFLYNGRYSQVFNQAGETFISAFEERNHFDLTLNYEFLAEDTSYIGMAKVYKNYLLDTEQLSLKAPTTLSNIPIRIDFVMSDVKKALIGTEDVVVTTISDVEDILLELADNGIYNINAGLYGYQSGGMTLGSKSKPDYSREIGTYDQFKQTISTLNDNGIDVSFAQNVAEINDVSMKLTNVANKHYNGRYMSLYDSMNHEGVTNTLFYARPTKITDYVKSQAASIQKLGFNSITYDGYTNLLYSDISKKRDINDTIERYQNVQSFIEQDYMINNVTPNQYLWSYTDRFLQTPMFSSQYIVETETVPFLQLLLNGTMELYTTYVNFSFYEQKDILKMVDYNTYPAFMLTFDPAYKLQKTNAQDFFSTEYQINEALIHSVYGKVNQALKHVSNATWLNRVEVEPNVFRNTYSNGVSIIINYQSTMINYEGVSIAPQSYIVIGV
jgi:hypothetical protein